MKVVVLSALGNAVAQRCVSSLLGTTTAVDFDLYLVREKGFREQTLNRALELTGIDEDILFVGDDIEFTPGWYEALTANYNKADILGMSMLYPGTAKVQDRGYDLIQIDDRIVLQPRDRGLLKEDITPFSIRHCDALCGCFMLVKSRIFDRVSSFSEEGQNRWGEFIFTSLARKKGASVGVIDHFLYHGGKSTKANKDRALSSISYQLERSIWETIVSKYVDRELVNHTYHSELTPALASKLSEAKDVLLWGAGTVSELLISYLIGKAVSVCSGLPEEEGMNFHGYKVENWEKALEKARDLIVLTPLDRGLFLYEKYVAPRIRNEDNTLVVAMTLKIEGDTYVYDYKKIAS